MTDKLTAKRKRPTAKQIVAVWDEIEDIDPEISTERLFALVCDHFRGVIDNGDVAAALAKFADGEKKETAG